MNEELIGLGRTWIGCYLLIAAATVMTIMGKMSVEQWMLIAPGAYALAAGVKQVEKYQAKKNGATP